MTFVPTKHVLADTMRMSVGTLTAVPVPPPDSLTTQVAARAMLLAPLAVAPLAAAAATVVLVGATLNVPAILTATLTIAALALGSRGLHLDGLADTADGLSCAGRSTDASHALDVMRRGDIGPMGAGTLFVVLLGQIAALAGAITAGHGVTAIVGAVIISRSILALCCVRGIPAARVSGLGAIVAGSVPRSQAAVLLAAVACIAALSGWQGVAAVGLAAVFAGAVLARCVQRLGGVTGDVLGACVEAAMLGSLVAFAA